MAIDQAEKIRKPGKFIMTGARIWLPLDVLQGAAYARQSHSSKALLLDLAAQLRAKHGNIINNGDLTTAKSVLSACGWKDEKTIRKAAQRLEQVGLIVKTRQGHYPNKSHLYAVTWLPLNESSKLDISARGFPFHAYLLENKLPAIKMISDREKIPVNVSDRGKLSPSNSTNAKLDRENIPLSEESRAV